MSIVNEDIIRPLLSCPFCRHKGMTEAKRPSQIPKIPIIQYFVCDFCGQRFYSEGWVNLIVERLTH